MSSSTQTLKTQLEWLIFDEIKFTGEPKQIIIGSLCVALLSALVTKLFWGWIHKEEMDVLKTRQRMRDPQLRNAPNGKHLWYTHDFLAQPGYCNVCQKHIIKGIRCEVCGFCAHSTCKVKAKKYSCKHCTQPQTVSIKHQWRNGNLPLLSVCFVCLKSCGNGAGLVDYRCIWCNRCVHTRCLPDIPTERCNLGRFRRMIVSPHRVTLKAGGWTKPKGTQTW
ncbi:hypothetical protein SARC_05421 [Sphaeroforma arctica JP610]|uniref:Phorbol-ester/DAG-type domain-containing protein n=1 Tax=Sphaeroforma arctica JP610 TaxID=667725 RepID=A0A0L0FZL6_9EUKA|nr:hypothetical protein SARC_05421 [Sphaeroforma arctica JP610]KNC82287.1 hypothetical protein SARC_05421 [Sphaeroforma arctica JP610]|eukprot:XP_014156189.1 hypothetical protein SARC_05421 [Sphaeroforma arctica JP610]